MWKRIFGKSPSGIIVEQYYRDLLGEEEYKKRKRNELIEQVIIRIIAMCIALFITYLVYRR